MESFEKSTMEQRGKKKQNKTPALESKKMSLVVSIPGTMERSHYTWREGMRQLLKDSRE